MNDPSVRGREIEANERAPIRHRWTAKPPGDSDEAMAGALLRTAKAVQPWPTKNLAEVAARLRGRERHVPRKWAWQIAIAVGLLLFGGVVSAAVMHFLRGPSVRPPLSVDPTSMPARVSARRKHVVAAQPPAPAVPPVPELPPVSAASEGKPESLPVKASLEPAPAPLANSSALAQESRLLAGAIHKLRQERNPGQALAMLDQHRSRFGANGALEPEAEVTRIEALLRLGRHDQALALLDAQALTATGVGREMLVARAELRAEKGRCGAALNDFNLLLATEAPPDLVTERALYGRATCRAQQSDWAGARSDLERYLARFPKGRFADQARTAVGR